MKKLWWECLRSRLSNLSSDAGTFGTGEVTTGVEGWRMAGIGVPSAVSNWNCEAVMGFAMVAKGAAHRGFVTNSVGTGY